MGILNTSPFQDQWSEQNSYVTDTPAPTEFGQGDFQAAAEAFNSTYALYKRGEYQSRVNDVTQFNGIEFNNENLTKSLRDQKYSEDVITRVLSRPLSNWNDALNATDHVTHIQETNQQLQENFSTAGMLAAGIPLALLDPIDLVTGAPILAAGKFIKKGLNLSTKLGLVANAAGTGSALSVASMATYEVAADYYNDGSLIEAAMFGAALGGGLGFIVEKAIPNPALTKEVNASGIVLTPAEAKAEKLANAQDAAERLQGVVDEVRVLEAEQKALGQEAQVSQRADAGRATVDATSIKAKISETVKLAREAKDNAIFNLKAATSRFTESSKIKGDIETSLLKAEQDVATIAVKQGAVKAATKEVNTVTKALTKAETKLADMAGVKDPKARVALKTEVTALKKQIRTLNNTIKLASSDLNKIPTDAAARLKDLESQQKVAAQDALKADNKLKAASNAKEETTAKAKAATAEDKAFKIREQAKLLKRDSLETKSLQEKLAEYDADLSPEGLQKLFEKNNVLQEDIAKMEAGDFTVKELYGIGKQRANFIKDLSNELDELNNTIDWKLSPTFKRLPPLMQKLFAFSPIEKLLNSANDAVVVLAGKLSNGTMHHGKVDNHNAHLVRQMLDHFLKRSRDNVTFQYKEAVKAGYKGSRNDFIDDVGQQINLTNGQLQRAAFTGMDMTLPEIERAAIARERMKTLERSYFTENEYIRKSVDSFLDYYKEINTKGKALGIDAFQNTFEKGYAKRLYSEGKIRKLGRENAINKIVQAQRNKAIYTNAALTPEIDAEYLAKATKAVDSALERRQIREAVEKPLGNAKQSGTSALKMRGIDAFEDDLIDVLDTDIESVTSVYGLQMHGKLALKETTGMMTDEEFVKVLTDIGATQKDKDNFKVILDTIRGTRELNKEPGIVNDIIKGVSSYSSIMHTMGFGVPTITEAAAMASQFGWTPVFNKLIGTIPEVTRAYRFGTPSEKNTIELYVSYGESFGNTRSNRLDDFGAIEGIDSKLQDFMSGIVHKESILSGLLPITDTYKATTAALTVEFMAGLSVAKKVSKTDRMRLQDIGFDLEDLERVRTTLNVQPDGRIANMDRKTWGALDVDINRAALNMVGRTILSPDGVTLPKFMTNMNNLLVSRILFKFMRFPFASYESLLGRGIQEADAKQMMGLAGNVAMWSGILALKDSIKDPDKQQYRGEKGTNQLMIDSFIYNSWTSLPFALADFGYGAVTGENLTNDYRREFWGVTASDLQKLRRGHPKFSVYGMNPDLGDTTANIFNQFSYLEEVAKD